MKFLGGHAHFYMPRPLINHFLYKAKPFFLHECLFEVEGGEMVVTGGEMVVTGRELDGGDWRRDVQWWSPETVVVGGSSEEETGCRLV